MILPSPTNHIRHCGFLQYFLMVHNIIKGVLVFAVIVYAFHQDLNCFDFFLSSVYRYAPLEAHQNHGSMQYLYKVRKVMPLPLLLSISIINRQYCMPYPSSPVLDSSLSRTKVHPLLHMEQEVGHMAFSHLPLYS